MAKQTHSDVTETTLNEPQGTQVAQQLSHLIPDLLGAEEMGGVTKPTGEFTLDEVVRVFRLNYTINPLNMEQHIWEMKDLDLDFKMTTSLMPLLENYAKNFDHSSEAVCRSAVGFVLNECLTVMKGNHTAETSQTTSNHQQKIPTPFDDLRVYGAVAINHEVSENPLTSSMSLSVSGRLDYGIGRVIYRWPGRRFQCFLIITAKAQFSVGFPQLLAYLACLHQSRLERNRTDASVYGVASDVYQFVFVTITHGGTVKISARFDILQGQLLKVLGWLKFILEKTAVMSCNVSGRDEKAGEDFDDPPIDLDDHDIDYKST